jgi:ornithine cyclodeaminase/alanine dehydrogenase-like protein (mu-crystallin family)
VVPAIIRVMPLLLDERALSPLLDMDSLIELMAQTLSAYSRGRVVQPVRHVLSLEPHGSFLGVMPAYLPETGALAVKVVGVAPRNSSRGLPTHLATLLLVDAQTGALLSVMDGRLVTEMRTAAVSAVSARALARDDAATLALLGSGVQAASHLAALSRVRALARVRVWSRTLEHARHFAQQHARSGGPTVEAVVRAEDAVRGADLIVTATASHAPVLEGRWLSAGVHLMAVGASRPEGRELDGEAVRRARVFVDSAEAARLEAGDLLQAESEGAVPANHTRGELGAVLAGMIPGRTRPDEITLFKSVGLAVEDVAAAHHLYRAALERGVGTNIEL